MFLKKKGPIDVPGGMILLPMFAAHPYNHFCTEYPPPEDTTSNYFLTVQHDELYLINCFLLAVHNWQKWKSRFLTCLCHKIYRIEAVSLKSSNYTLKLTIFVNAI